MKFFKNTFFSFSFLLLATVLFATPSQSETAVVLNNSNCYQQFDSCDDDHPNDWAKFDECMRGNGCGPE